jgi:BirA family transcriptional regulator, biotin operon repressor / biotin---[acetyl-CoA-carboxylase] ligase
MKDLFGYSFDSLQEIDSTNSFAKKHLDEKPDRHIVLADIQTAGKGRFSRNWVSSNPENLYFSLILKSDLLAEAAGCLTQYASVVLAETFEKYLEHIQVNIKWPNDVLVKGKKISGILAETVTCARKSKGYVLGVGVNLNMSEEELKCIDQPATSLNLLVGEKIDKRKFLLKFLRMFFSEYDKFLTGGFELVRKRYTIRTNLLGKTIQVNNSDSITKGTVAGFSENGQLLLKIGTGKPVMINSGEINLCLK